MPSQTLSETPGWWSEASAVLVKDLRSELRTRAAVATILLFAVVTLILVSLTVRTEGMGLTMVPYVLPDAQERLRADPHAVVIEYTVPGETEPRAYLLASLLWIILLFSAMMGLPRTFVKEEEMRTAPALRLMARPAAVFAGKLLFNAALVLAVGIVVVPLFLILMKPRVADWPSFLLNATAGLLAMAGAATVLGAIVSRAGGKSYLMLPLAFPVLLPILVLAINGTANAALGKGGNQVIALVSYFIAMVVVSAGLFERVWNDG